MTEASGIRDQALRCRDAAQVLAQLDTGAKDALLRSMAAALEHDADAILAANARDLEAARARGTAGAMLDRLALALDLRLERAVRNWAAHELQARVVVQAVDRQRIDYLIALCREEGSTPAQARDLATLTYAVYLGLQQLFGEDEQAALRRLAPKVEFVLPTAPRGGKARP